MHSQKMRPHCPSRFSLPRLRFDQESVQGAASELKREPRTRA